MVNEAVILLAVEFVKWVIENHPGIYTEFLDVRMRSADELRKDVDAEERAG